MRFVILYLWQLIISLITQVLNITFTINILFLSSFIFSLFPYISLALSLPLVLSFSADISLSFSLSFRHSLSLYTQHTQIFIFFFHFQLKLKGNRVGITPSLQDKLFSFFFSSFLSLNVLHFRGFQVVVSRSEEKEEDKLKKKLLCAFPKLRNEGMLVGLLWRRVEDVLNSKKWNPSFDKFRDMWS